MSTPASCCGLGDDVLRTFRAVSVAHAREVRASHPGTVIYLLNTKPDMNGPILPSFVQILDLLYSLYFTL